MPGKYKGPKKPMKPMPKKKGKKKWNAVIVSAGSIKASEKSQP